MQVLFNGKVQVLRHIREEQGNVYFGLVIVRLVVEGVRVHVVDLFVNIFGQSNGQLDEENGDYCD